MRASQVTELKRMLPINHEFKNGDTIGFMLDLRDNARHHSEDDSENLALAPPGRGKLTLRYKGKSYLVASNLGGELWPVFNMDNISEQLSLDFVIDGEDGDGTAVIRRTLEVPTRSTCENLFHRVDGTRSAQLHHRHHVAVPKSRGSVPHSLTRYLTASYLEACGVCLSALLVAKAADLAVVVLSCYCGALCCCAHSHAR
jgi:hypothetical protein